MELLHTGLLILLNTSKINYENAVLKVMYDEHNWMQWFVMVPQDTVMNVLRVHDM